MSVFVKEEGPGGPVNWSSPNAARYSVALLSTFRVNRCTERKALSSTSSFLLHHTGRLKMMIALVTVAMKTTLAFAVTSRLGCVIEGITTGISVDMCLALRPGMSVHFFNLNVGSDLTDGTAVLL